jgi:hypothetical protein
MTEITFGKGSYHLQKDMINWCREQFGDGSVYGGRGAVERWSMDSAFGHTVFYFRNEADAVVFSLRWS